MANSIQQLSDGSLVDALDRLIETGVVAAGDVVLGLADVDLIRLNLRLVLASVDSLTGPADQSERVEEPADWRRADTAERLHPATAGTSPRAAGTSQSSGRALPPLKPSEPSRTQLLGRLSDPASDLVSPDRANVGIGGLVVAVVEIVRQLLERQALRRMDSGSLTDEQVERLGVALMQLERATNQLAELFGLRSSDVLQTT